jgi:ABC-type lipoprotein release transport system permease subunit
MEKKLNKLLSPLVLFDLLAIFTFIMLAIFAGLAGAVFGLLMSVFLVLHLLVICRGTNNWTEFWHFLRGHI